MVKKGGWGLDWNAFAPSRKIPIAREPRPTATPSAAAAHPHIRSRRPLSPSVAAIGFSLGLPRCINRLERVADEALRAPDGARDVEAPIEVSEVLRSFEGFLEGGLGEAERRCESFELARVDFLH